VTLTIGSLFSGIGGLELGLERGIGDARTGFQVEQNAYCRAVLAKHWPDALRFDDVRTVGRHNLPGADVLCGGFPCQDISVAGKGAGIAGGARSGLWYEFQRIIEELSPRWVVIENVAAIESPTHRASRDAVLGGLRSLGYCGERAILSAADVGAPHRRDRWFVLAHHRSQRVSGYVIETISRQPAFSWCEDGRRVEDFRGRSDVPEPLVRRTSDGFASGVDRLRAIGNAVVPQVAEVVGRLIAQREADSVAA
jgi:DNA (cytosine-5)-methyltransferase 1